MRTAATKIQVLCSVTNKNRVGVDGFHFFFILFYFSFSFTFTQFHCICAKLPTVPAHKFYARLRKLAEHLYFVARVRIYTAVQQNTMFCCIVLFHFIARVRAAQRPGASIQAKK